MLTLWNLWFHKTHVFSATHFNQMQTDNQLNMFNNCHVHVMWSQDQFIDACIITWIMSALAYNFSWRHHFHVGAQIRHVPQIPSSVTRCRYMDGIQQQLTVAVAVSVVLLDGGSHVQQILAGLTLLVSIRVQYTLNCHPGRKMNQSVFAKMLQGSW